MRPIWCIVAAAAVTSTTSLWDPLDATPAAELSRYWNRLAGDETPKAPTRRQRRRRDAKCAEHWEQPVWRRRVWWRMENRQIFWCFLSCTSVCVGGWSVVRAERVDIVDSVLVDVERWDEGWNATSCRHLRQTFVGLWSLLRGRQGQTLPTHRHANPQRSVYILRILTQFYLFS